ncbi:MAG: hypothetical protein WBV74_20365 [Pseudonocardiaceae bacterium]
MADRRTHRWLLGWRRRELRYARAAESLGGSYYFLDLTALGRQEDWEEPKGRTISARGAIPDFSA